MLKEIEDSFKTSYNETPFVNKPNSSLQQQFFVDFYFFSPYNILYTQEKTEEIRDPSPKFVLKTHKYDVVEMNIANEEKYVNPTSKEMKLKIALEETQQNFNVKFFFYKNERKLSWSLGYGEYQSRNANENWGFKTRKY